MRHESGQLGTVERQCHALPVSLHQHVDVRRVHGDAVMAQLVLASGDMALADGPDGCDLGWSASYELMDLEQPHTVRLGAQDQFGGAVVVADLEGDAVKNLADYGLHGAHHLLGYGLPVGMLQQPQYVGRRLEEPGPCSTGALPEASAEGGQVQRIDAQLQELREITVLRVQLHGPLKIRDGVGLPVHHPVGVCHAVVPQGVVSQAVADGFQESQRPAAGLQVVRAAEVVVGPGQDADEGRGQSGLRKRLDGLHDPLVLTRLVPNVALRQEVAVAVVHLHLLTHLPDRVVEEGVGIDGDPVEPQDVVEGPPHRFDDRGGHMEPDIILYGGDAVRPGPELLGKLGIGPLARRDPVYESPEQVLGPDSEGVRDIGVVHDGCAEHVVLRERTAVAEHRLRSGLRLLACDGIGRFLILLHRELFRGVETHDPPAQETGRLLPVRPLANRFEVRGAGQVAYDRPVSCEDVSSQVPAPERGLVRADGLRQEGVCGYQQAEEVGLPQGTLAVGTVGIVIEPHTEVEPVAPLEQGVESAAAEILPFVGCGQRVTHSLHSLGIGAIERHRGHLDHHRWDPDPPLRRHEPADYLLRVPAAPLLQVHADVRPGCGVDLAVLPAPSQGDLVPGHEQIHLAITGVHRRVGVDTPSLEPAEAQEGHPVLLPDPFQQALSPLEGQEVVFGSVQEAAVVCVHGIGSTSPATDKYV